jgi:hypothetical protein
VSKQSAKKQVVNAGQYRKCLNNQTLEMLSTLSRISAEETVKVFSDTEYRMSSVDGEAYPITLFVNKLWDLILLKLTEVVTYDKRSGHYVWYDKTGEAIDRDICLSVKTIAECLNTSTTANALVSVYCDIQGCAEQPARTWGVFFLAP